MIQHRHYNGCGCYGEGWDAFALVRSLQKTEGNVNVALKVGAGLFIAGILLASFQAVKHRKAIGRAASAGAQFAAAAAV